MDGTGPQMDGSGPDVEALVHEASSSTAERHEVRDSLSDLRRRASFDAAMPGRRSVNGDMVQRSQSLPLMSPSEQFQHWYPDWGTWKFRRTLAYWISIMYCEGSLLFTWGGAFSLTEIKDESVRKALIDVPYLVGGVCFTLGGYAGVLELINVRNPSANTALLSREAWTELSKARTHARDARTRATPKG